MKVNDSDKTHRV